MGGGEGGDLDSDEAKTRRRRTKEQVRRQAGGFPGERMSQHHTLPTIRFWKVNG